MTATERVVHFSLLGSDFTRLVRDIFLSDDPNKAYRVITTGLRGGSGIEQLATAVLDGDKRFTGNETDGIEPADELPKITATYKKQVRFVYAGRIKIHGKWYRPIAKVTSWGRDDLRNEHGVETRTVYNSSNVPKGISNRSWHYARRGEIVQEISKDRHDHIFEPCGEPPHWWQPNRTAEQAVEDAISAGRVMEERGWNISYGALYSESDVYEDEPDVEDSVDSDEDVESDKAERLRIRIEKEAEDEKRYKAEDAAREAQIAGYREKILEQAHGDMLRLEWDGGHLDVPRSPFINWALERRKKLRHLAPKWDRVCPSGLKLQLDSEYHSDWMVGAGLEINSSYHSHPAQEAAVAKMFEIQRELGKFNCAVLVEGATAYGYVQYGKPNKKSKPGAIVLLPNLSAKYLEATIGASAVIAEAGGKTAHLAQVGLVNGLPIVVMRHARKQFPEGSRLTVDTVNGRVTAEDEGDEW